MSNNRTTEPRFLGMNTHRKSKGHASVATLAERAPTSVPDVDGMERYMKGWNGHFDVICTAVYLRDRLLNST